MHAFRVAVVDIVAASALGIHDQLICDPAILTLGGAHAGLTELVLESPIHDAESVSRVAAAVSQLERLRYLEMPYMCNASPLHWQAVHDSMQTCSALTHLRLGWRTDTGVQHHKPADAGFVVSPLTQLRYLHVQLHRSDGSEQANGNTMLAVANLVFLCALVIAHPQWQSVKLLAKNMAGLTKLTSLELTKCACGSVPDDARAIEQNVDKLLRYVAIGMSRIRSLVKLVLHVSGSLSVDIENDAEDEDPHGGEFTVDVLNNAFVLNKSFTALSLGGALNEYELEGVLNAFTNARQGTPLLSYF